MTRGRKRKHDPSVPDHIDQKKLPTGCYWNRRDRYWYTFAGEPAKRKRIGDATALMSELHAAIEAARGTDRDTLDYMLGKFHASKKFSSLAKTTQDDYGYCRLALQRHMTKLGTSVADLSRRNITMPFLQRLVDTIAEQHPSKANHVKRYLALTYAWGKRRGYATENPAAGLEAAAEKRDPKMPDKVSMRNAVALWRDRGAYPSRRKGSLAPYLWAVAEIAYRCRMRSVEVRDLTDANSTDEGIVVRRRKGSRDNLTRWSPELHEAWDWLIARRSKLWTAKSLPIPLQAASRSLVVAEDGAAVSKSALNSAWRRAMAMAIKEKVLVDDVRFALHGLKHRGITDTAGTRADKQQASGHKNEHMMDVYDHEMPVVDAAGKPKKGA